MQLVGLLWDPGVLGVVARAGPCSFRQLTHSLGKPAQRTLKICGIVSSPRDSCTGLVALRNTLGDSASAQAR